MDETAFLCLLDYRQLNEMYFVVELLEGAFDGKVSHHLVKLEDNLGDRVGIIGHGRVVCPLNASPQASEQVVEAIGIIPIVELDRVERLGEDEDANVGSIQCE